ncbi:hypothetical protein IJT93_09945, partial [bacterium]|nr:hypothetical protein [bacterium]
LCLFSFALRSAAALRSRRSLQSKRKPVQYMYAESLFLLNLLTALPFPAAFSCAAEGRRAARRIRQNIS